MNTPDNQPLQKPLNREERLQRIRGIREWLNKELNK